jgi:hypothetical protein
MHTYDETHHASQIAAGSHAPDADSALDTPRSYIVPVLSKALHILRLLEREQRPITTNELARRTGYSLTTVYRILRTLDAHAFLPDACAQSYGFRPPRGPQRKRTAASLHDTQHTGAIA